MTADTGLLAGSDHRQQSSARLSYARLSRVGYWTGTLAGHDMIRFTIVQFLLQG